jgi:hypothetical protein
MVYFHSSGALHPRSPVPLPAFGPTINPTRRKLLQLAEKKKDDEKRSNDGTYQLGIQALWMRLPTVKKWFKDATETSSLDTII